jgi:hypothetical protein
MGHRLVITMSTHYIRGPLLYYSTKPVETLYIGKSVEESEKRTRHLTNTTLHKTVK